MTDQQPFSNSLFTGTSDGPAAAQPQRLFYYDNQLFEDPGPEYSNRDILNFLAETYPELRQGSWSSRTLPDGTEEVTFHKVTGEKGTVPRRRFLYKGQELDDPDPDLPIWQVRQMLSFSLRRPVVVGVIQRDLPDGVETVILTDGPRRVFRIGEDDYPDPAPLLPVSQVRQTFVAALGVVPHQWRIDKGPDGSQLVTFYDPPAA
ncbi:MAG: hypothetical protein D6722_15110 [Bacteroidetes bacterium]|nr:MAG: hypothetical protein D6722_15110 [Bacteroidota bacterium]